MYSGYYYCDGLEYNIGKWWICDDDKITIFRGYSKNINDELSHRNKQK